MKKLFFAVIILGVIGISVNAVFGWNTFTWLEQIKVADQVYMYKLNVWGYMENLKNSFNNISTLGIEMPPDPDWSTIGTSIASLTNWVLFFGNILTWQFRVGGYMLLNVLALLGINVIDANSAGGLQWLVNICEFLRNLSIEYIS